VLETLDGALAGALELPADGGDLHLIYGANEAGKSSLLRAIRDLLYGIHGQTAENFRHAYKDLRIAGSIVASDDRRLRFQRRNGNKETLLDADGQPGRYLGAPGAGAARCRCPISAPS